MIDTHAHIDSPEFAEDLAEVVARAKEAGVAAIGVPGICLKDTPHLLQVCGDYPDYLFPMIGLHPENIGDTDYHKALDELEDILRANLQKIVAVGEVGLDFYWDDTHKAEQAECFERQVEWAARYDLPLMIHARKAHAELMRIMKKHQADQLRGVFHCFTGSKEMARDLLSFPNFMLGIGGVVTFKNSTLPEVLKNAVPLSRIVLETDSPYMAPTPHRGTRNESAHVKFVAEKLAETYGVSFGEVVSQTSANAAKVFQKLPFFKEK